MELFNKLSNTKGSTILKPKLLLTIAIPTYNRLDCLRLLLESIFIEVSNKKHIFDKLEVLVSNNNSTDNTREYLENFKTTNSLKCLHNNKNIGASANVVQCFKEAHGEYVWIIGDDDLPLIGSIVAVIDTLEKLAPDTLYLPAKWINGSLEKYQSQRIKGEEVTLNNKLQIIAHVNSHVTFISSWVVNKSRYTCSNRSPDRYIHTNLPHLEWIFNLIMNGGDLLIAEENWLLARGGASGGYDLIDIFTNQYFKIIDENINDIEIVDILKKCMLYVTIPSFLWGAKNQSLGSFKELKSTTIADTLRRYYRKELEYRIIIDMMFHPNKVVSIVSRSIGKIIGYIVLLKIKRSIVK